MRLYRLCARLLLPSLLTPVAKFLVTSSRESRDPVLFVAADKRRRLCNTSSTNSSQHSSCGWDIWSDIPEHFQHLSKTIRHRGGVLATASAFVCCCCKSVILWRWQPAKGFRVHMRDTGFFREKGCGWCLCNAVIFHPRTAGCSGSQQHPGGPLLLCLSSTERVHREPPCLIMPQEI